jgi:NAD(P)-dependent dehydrogenase (short-subunit alcohol dehydrogenase family)
MAATHTLVMTGAGHGIGRIAAETILRNDPTIHLVVVARGDSGRAVAAELSAGGRSVSSVSADLGSLSSVRSAAAELASQLQRGKLPPLRGFVGNAGIQYTNALTKGADGHEATFTVNVLANHILIRALEKHFAPDSRITLTVSDTHFGDFKHNMGMVPGPVWQAPEKLAGTSAFDKVHDGPRHAPHGPHVYGDQPERRRALSCRCRPGHDQSADRFLRRPR